LDARVKKSDNRTRKIGSGKYGKLGSRPRKNNLQFRGAKSRCRQIKEDTESKSEATEYPRRWYHRGKRPRPPEIGVWGGERGKVIRHVKGRPHSGRTYGKHRGEKERKTA